MNKKNAVSPALGMWSLVGLALGFGVGIAGQYFLTGPITSLAGLLAPFGTLWINLLQMVVIPLVLTQLLAALVRPGETPAVGRLGVQTFGLALSLLVMYGTLTLAATPPILDSFSFPTDFADAIIRIETPAGVMQAASAGGAGASSWLVGLVPPNVFEAAFRGDLIQLLVFTVLMGMAAGRLPDERRDPLARVFRSLAEAIMILVAWVLWLTPLAVFGLMLGFSLQTGVGVVGVSALYVGLICGALGLGILLLYPITIFFGRVSLRSFARAALTAQIVAAGTQSSAATLPALIEDGRNRLGLSEEAVGFVLPLCVASFKLNLVISQCFALLFFARVFHVPIGMGTALTFLLGVIVISAGSPGLPRGGAGFKTLPLHLAAGIPIEAVVLLETLKTIPDVLFTVLNSTSYLSVATILSRWRGQNAEPHA